MVNPSVLLIASRGVSVLENSMLDNGYAVECGRYSERVTSNLRDSVFDAVVLYEPEEVKRVQKVVTGIRNSNADIPMLLIGPSQCGDSMETAFELGVNEYVGADSFNFECDLRLKKMLNTKVRPKQRVLVCGEIVLSLCDRTVITPQRKEELTAQEFIVLRCLMERRGLLVAKDFIKHQLHSGGRSDTDSLLYVVIHRLRSILGKKPIRTVRGKGFRFEVEELS